MTTLATILFALLAALQIGDWITTARALRRPGTKEALPIRHLMRWIGLHPALAVKTALVMAIGWLLARDGWVLLLAATCAFYVWVCFNNWRIAQ